MAQAVFLMGLVLLGYAPQLCHLSAGINLSPAGAELYFDPVFVVNVESELLQSISGSSLTYGLTFGNIVLLDASLSEWSRDAFLIHEMVHVSQFRALGPWLLLFYAVSPTTFEPHFHLSDDKLGELMLLSPPNVVLALARWSADSMWNPNQNNWHFFCLLLH